MKKFIPDCLYREKGKRIIDAVSAAALLVACIPLFVALWGLVRLKLGSPILFWQERPGLQGKSFRLYKFRTMTDNRDAAGNLLPDEVRLTKFGRWLRATSLDELPELWNILIGDMSFVGPRPLLVQYLPLYNPEQARRHEVRPGLTGWAQIHGRNATTWEERLARDVWYVDNLSLRTDLAIAFATVGKVLAREGIRHEASATMPAFAGNEQGIEPSSHAA